MIENVKRFVNEHHTLMVVIIGVLVICFIYWWFYCKDKPLANKVKGGLASYKIAKINNDYYKIVGISLANENLIVLSQKGENLLKTLDETIKYFYIYFESFTKNEYINNINNKYNIVKVIKEPCTYFNLENGKTKNTGAALIGSKNISTFINETKCFSFSNITNHCIEEIEGNDEKSQIRKDNLSLVLQKYNELVKFVKENASAYFDEAEFIGQPSVYKYTANSDYDTKDDSPLYRFSIISQISMSNSLYTSCNNEVRNWYNTDSVNNAISRCYYLIPNDGDIQDNEKSEIDNDEFLQNVDKPINKNTSLDCGITAVSDLESIDEEQDEEQDEQQDEEQDAQTEAIDGKRKRKKISYAGMDADDDDDEKPRKRKKSKKTIKLKKNKVSFQVADIFPANKVISTVLFLLGLLETFINKYAPDEENDECRNKLKDEYFQMISSYMIYVHLLNICCGVRMTSRWNIKISNAYVYKYIQKDVNVQDKTSNEENDLFMIKQLKTETGKQIAEMLNKFINDECVVQGFIKMLGNEGMEKIINEFTPEYWNKIDASNAINYADEIFDIIRNVQLITDVNFNKFMNEIKGNEKTQNLYIFCHEILNQKLFYSEESLQSIHEGRNIDLTSINTINELKKIQHNIIDYIDDPANIEENFQKIENSFSDIKIHDDKQLVKDVLIFINNVSLYHYRGSYFISKIEKIILFFKDDFSKFFSNYEIFKIFKENLRIILFLHECKIINFDDNRIISWYLHDERHIYYFNKEIKSSNQVKIDDPKYELKRKKGENDSLICELIRNNSIDDFESHINKNGIDLNSHIKESIYETNQMLLKNKNVSLIQYAAFFGSDNIFYFLIERGVEINISILKFAVHGKNTGIIRTIIDEIDSKNINKADAEEVLLTTIQCFNGDFFQYYNTLFEITDEFYSFCLKYSLKYRNYNICLNASLDNLETILAKYDCYIITEHLLKIKTHDIEKIWLNSLRYSCYDFINLIYTAKDEKIHIDEFEFKICNKFIKDGKESSNVERKIMLFIKAYILGVNTKEKYKKKSNIKSLDDEFMKFLEICDGADYPPIVTLLKIFAKEENPPPAQTPAPPTPEQIAAWRSLGWIIKPPEDS